jgi:hypothetical protein
MDFFLNLTGSMFEDSSSIYFLAGGAFLLVFLYLVFKKLKSKGRLGKKESTKPDKKEMRPPEAGKEVITDEMVVDKKMAKLAAKAAKEAKKKAALAAKLEKKHSGKLFGRQKAAEPAPAAAPVQKGLVETDSPPPMVNLVPTQGLSRTASGQVLAMAAQPVSEAMSAPATGHFKALQLKAAQTVLPTAAPLPPEVPTMPVAPPSQPAPLSLAPAPPPAPLAPAAPVEVSPAPLQPPVKLTAPPPVPPVAAPPAQAAAVEEPQVSLAAKLASPPPASTGVRIASGQKSSSRTLAPETLSVESPDVRPTGDSEPIDIPELTGPAASQKVQVVTSGPSSEIISASFSAPEPQVPAVLNDQILSLEPSDTASLVYSNLGVSEAEASDTVEIALEAAEPEDGDALDDSAQAETDETSDNLVQNASGLDEFSLEAVGADEDIALKIASIAAAIVDELSLDTLKPAAESAAAADASPASLAPPTIAETSPVIDVVEVEKLESPPAFKERRAPRPAQPDPADSAPPVIPAMPVGPEYTDSRADTQVVAKEPVLLDPLKAKPMSVLEGRSGVLKASQTQMSTPIEIDQTQMPRIMKEAYAHASPVGQSVTVQDLEVNYEKNTFLSPMEVIYYKLLRSAFNQFLIFPKVTSRAAVNVSSRNSEHLKVAENVLSGTCISFVICDVKLNIKAVVELVDDSAPPSNKERARDYILKKAGCVLVRFYSGDTPPDVGTLRRLLLD